MLTVGSESIVNRSLLTIDSDPTVNIGIEVTSLCLL
jgi:hypothetical protein